MYFIKLQNLTPHDINYTCSTSASLPIGMYMYVASYFIYYAYRVNYKVLATCNRPACIYIYMYTLCVYFITVCVCVHSIDNEHIHSDLSGEIKGIMSNKEATQVKGNPEVEQLDSDTIKADPEKSPSHIVMVGTDIEEEKESYSQTVSTGTVNIYSQLYCTYHIMQTHPV